MGVLYITKQFSGKSGVSISKRDIILRFLNEAVHELYVQSDMPGCCMEAPFKVNGDQTITLPFDIGTIRAVRGLFDMQSWHINQMRPRYNQFNWTDLWRNYRIRNNQALMATVSNASVGVIKVPLVETPNITVSLTGPTATATQITEVVTIKSLLTQTVNQFTDYIAASKSAVTSYDVTLQDVDGKLLTVIPNTELQANYQVIDISNAPWLSQNTSVVDNYVEILYKKKLKYLSNDNDEFPACINYDDVIVNKMMQLFNEEQGKTDIAMAYDTKATRSLARITEDQNRETEDMISLVANPHDTILKRIGTGLRRRYSMWSGRRF